LGGEMNSLQTQHKCCGYRLESNWFMLRSGRSLACHVLS
jgi:hypothetical protein